MLGLANHASFLKGTNSMEQSFMLNTGLVLGRFVIGSMLALAGILKLKAGPNWFLHQILAYELVKGKLAWLLAKGLPWAEIILSSLLITGFLAPAAALLSFVLLWIFTIAVISAFLRDKRVDCSCFGHSGSHVTGRVRWIIAYRNLGVMGLLLVIIVAGNGSLSLDTGLTGHSYGLISESVLFSLALLWLLSLAATITLHQIIWKNQIISKSRSNSAISATKDN
jgi:uncharacterized membrane protein YphA (DoxX/SURF4 family)